ncbi:hypothetical protein A3Q56_03508 [Intoshia linei]|uniref:Serpin domain-containing protein n=1 Tax=Intoshia linei TaxID=1819745 RepID=A0A177B385_9BILA|nr:hypothetical protein A3Q56_03508 [Intoshia linei]
MKPGQVELYLPKFSVTTKKNMKDEFKTIGLLTNQTDFSGISDDELTLNQFVHIAHIDIDDKGTSASAANAATMNETSVRATINIDTWFQVWVIYTASNTKKDIVVLNAVIDEPIY